MPKIQASKVATPGSAPPVNRTTPVKKTTPRKAGRPKQKKKDKKRGRYSSYDDREALDNAINAVTTEAMGIREASLHFGVPKATLCDKVGGKAQGNIGRPTVLSVEEEAVLVQRLIVMGEWGYPLTPKDLCMLVKDYLDAAGQTTRNVKICCLSCFSQKIWFCLKNTYFYQQYLLYISM